MNAGKLKPWVLPLAALLLLAWQSFAQDSAAPVAQPADAVAVADSDRTAVRYLDVPPGSEPLNSLLPKGGIQQSPAYLKKPERNLIYEHNVDYENREATVRARFANGFSKDTTDLWEAHYPELALYTMDMYDIGLNRIWLNSLIGQKDAGAEEAVEGALFDISIPVNLPSWMKDFGFDKPKLLLQGTMDIRLAGRGVVDDAPGSTQDDLFPSPTLNYEPSFIVKGKIGRNITVEINNTQGGLGVRNQIRVVYEEATPGEFEDYVLQRVEAGNTSLSLAGTELTGYAENHQGLFGIKTEWKIGDWRLTTIASQDGGSQESYTIKGGNENTEYQIQDKQFAAYRYYFPTHSMRTAYVEAKILGNSPARANLTGLKLYKRSPSNNKVGIIEDALGVYFPPSNAAPVYLKGLPLVEMDPSTEYSYDAATGILRLKNANRNTLIAASWSGDGTGRAGSSVRNGDPVILIQYDATASNLTGIDQLMLRNVYGVGISESNSSQFILRMKDRSQNAGNYLKTLGVVDSSKGTVLVNDVAIFPKSGKDYTGDMWLPCHDITWYQDRKVSDPAAKARKNCLEPLRNIDSSATINNLYTLSVNNLSKYQALYYFESVGKRRSSSISVRDPGSSYAVGGGSCMDIAPGSEKLKAGSEVLVRDRDYQVTYELGQIELISERALDPNKEITVSYECEPLFELDSKVLLGARAEYPLRRFASGSLLGLTALYKSQNITSEQPRLGSEPFSSFLWGGNLRLIDSSKTMDRMVNAIPFIDTKARSRWSVEGEFAAVYHNANTSENKSALLDDFEGSSQALQFPLSRVLWTHASPPGGTTQDPSTYIEKQDYRHAGEFVWHSNSTQLYRYVYTPVGNSDVDNRQLTVLNFRLRPNDNLDGNSWGGVMRSNSSYYQDLSSKRFLEVVARGNVGSIYVDLGTVSEDIAVNGFAPNSVLNAEANAGTTVALSDLGLDSVKESSERRLNWDCRTSECMSEVIDATTVTSSNTDIARDNFNFDLTEDTDPPMNINGTEGNAGERTFDSEDIDRNGTLDTDIRFVRYRIDLSNDDVTTFEKLNNGWRRWRIPLDQYDTIVSGTGSTWQEILSESRYTRLWYGALNPGVAEGKAQLVDFKIVGNEWEETSGENAFGISTNDVTQSLENGSMNGDITAPGSVVVADSNYLSVRVLNNREDAGSYFTSPNTPIERDAETNAALKEQSLVLEYGGLHAGQSVSATRFFDNEIKDLTSYKNLKLEIHYETEAETVPVRFALQFGQGGLDGSSDYYEWSFKPSKLDCANGERTQDCHERNWEENAFALALSEFTALKAGRVPPYLQDVEKPISSDSTSIAFKRDERVKLVGNPSTGRINWIRFVIIADESAMASDLKGVFWVNDLRLSGMDSEWGYATRAHGQLDFADVMGVSGELRYQDGNFATLKSEGSSPKPTLSEANTRLDVNGNFSFNLNKFFDDEYGLHMPLGLSYSSTITRPYLKPGSDQPLTRDDYGDLIPELLSNDLEVNDSASEASLRSGSVPESKGYQSFSRSRTLSLGYSKDYKKDDKLYSEVLSQIFLERPALNYSYRETESKATTSADSSYSYNTVLEYKLGAFNRSDIRLFKNMKSTPWTKGFARMALEPWPQTFDVTVMDLTYSKTIDQERDPDYVNPQVDKVVDYNVELRHKANIRWNILPFLSTNYTLSINRDMYGGGDREAFVKENYFSPDQGGLFAANRFFDYDHTDRKIYKRDSLYIYPVDTLHNDSLGTDSIVNATAVYYIVDSVGTREYGRAYGILRNERSRSQDFRINFNPELVPFLPTRFTFASTFNQNKTIPDNFDFTNASQVEKNFWTINHTNRFEFAPTLKLVEVSSLGGKNAVSRFLEKLRWRDLRSTWTVDLNTVGEDFTLWQLHDEQGVTPAQYYLYGLGFGNGYRNRGFWNLVSGDMGLDTRSDYVRFAQYRNSHVDSSVYQGRFEHTVKRTLTNGTSLTLPWWDIGVKGDLSWSQQFQQPRENPLYLDTTVIWPKVGLGVDIPNFSHRLAFTRGKLKSLSTNHRLDYADSRTSRPFQSAEDEWKITWDFNPLIRISALTPRGIRIDNSVRFKMEETERRPKEEVLSSSTWPDSSVAFSDTSEVYIKTPWVHTLLYRDRGYALGDELSISYALRAKRGFQLWRWYIKLDNDIDLRLASGYDYKTVITETYTPKTGYSPWNKSSGTNGVHAVILLPSGQTITTYTPALDKLERTVPTRSHEWYVRPSAGYTFNKMASASAYIEYRHLTEQLDEGTKHTQQTLAFEIALLLRFN